MKRSENNMNLSSGYRTGRQSPGASGTRTIAANNTAPFIPSSIEPTNITAKGIETNVNKPYRGKGF
jgi:hypothetical protein